MSKATSNIGKPYLEFEELTDYVAYLRDRADAALPVTSHAEISLVSSAPDPSGIVPLTYYIVLTQFYGDLVAVWSMAVVQTSNLDLMFEKNNKKPEEQTPHKVITHFESWCNRIQKEFNIVLKRGRYKWETPRSLK